MLVDEIRTNEPNCLISMSSSQTETLEAACYIL